MQKLAIMSLIAILLMFAAAYAVCQYLPHFTITDDSVTTLFPNAGDRVALKFSIDSTELYTGVLKAYLEKDNVQYPISEEMVYIVPGKNLFAYEFSVPKAIASGVYVLHVKANDFSYRIPLIVNGSGKEPLTYEETPKNITIRASTDERVTVKWEKIYSDGRVENRQYAITPENGTATIAEGVCTNCKLVVSIGYDGLLARIEKVYGDYSEPYVKVVGLAKDKVVLETCATAGYNAYLDGESSGRMVGIGRMEKQLNGGYETLVVGMSDKGTILERNVELAAFVSQNITTTVRITAEAPLTVQLTVRDEFGRDVQSEGEIAITGEDGTVYYENVAFAGSTERKYNLADGRYTVVFNGVSAVGNAKLMPQEQKPPETKGFELIPQDLVPIIVAVLVITLIILFIVWTRKWRRNV